MRARSLVIAAVVSSLALVACGSRVDETDGGGDGTSDASTENTASDTGVTETSIKIGSIAGLGGQLFGDTFSAPLYGAQAYFEQLNAAGGVNGRTVDFIPCDDQSNGGVNFECVTKLVDEDEVFALTGGASFDYAAGAEYVNEAEVPDVGGQPVTSAYDQYPHLYSIYGGFYPRTGDAPGYGGTLYAGTEQFQFFKVRANARVAAVVYYNVAPSERYANFLADGLTREGYTVIRQPVNYGVANWESVVLSMKSQGVQLVFDAMDDAGNTGLCRAIETQDMPLLGKITTAQGWTDKVRTVYADSPTCRNALYATGVTANYYDTDIPAVAEFNEAVDEYLPDDIAAVKSMWMLEGYGAAKMLTAAIESCGADLTRECVEEWLNTETYDGDGLFIPRSFKPQATPPTQARNCLNAAKWENSAADGEGGWETQVDDMTTNCFNVPMLPYPAG